MADSNQRRKRYIRWGLQNFKRPIRRLVKWAKVRDRIKRFGSLQQVARQKQEAAVRAKSRAKWKILRFRFRKKVQYLESIKNQVNAGNFETFMLNGHPGNISTGTKAAIARGVAHGLYTTSTTDGSSHTPTSNHYSWNHPDNLGHAVDMGGTYSNMVAWQQSEANRGEDLRELIGPDNTLTYSGGTRWTQSEGSSLETAHDNHVHRAVYG
jgi:hypothetical protein